MSKVSFLNDVSAWISIASANQYNIFSFERPLRSDLLLVFKYLTNIRNVQDFIISKVVNIGGTRKIPILNIVWQESDIAATHSIHDFSDLQELRDQ